MRSLRCVVVADSLGELMYASVELMTEDNRYEQW